MAFSWIYLNVGVVVALIALGAVAINTALESLDIGSACLPRSLEQAQAKVPFKIRSPHVLPVGYKLQAVDVVTGPRGWVSLYYWDKSMCPFSESIHAYALKGVISVNAYDETYNSGTDFVNKALPSFEGGLADVKSLTLNGNLGIGWSPFTGVNRFEEISQGAIKVIKEEPVPMPGAIWMFYEKDKIVYRIVANMPVEDIAKIAESLS